MKKAFTNAPFKENFFPSGSRIHMSKVWSFDVPSTNIVNISYLRFVPEFIPVYVGIFSKDRPDLRLQKPVVRRGIKKSRIQG